MISTKKASQDRIRRTIANREGLHPRSKTHQNAPRRAQLPSGPGRIPKLRMTKLMLLSFLTQADCRVLGGSTRERYIDYYLSLRGSGVDWIAHPAALFII